jgi:phosphocarrier protein FPr
MVAIVIVSHSVKLAEGVRELAQQMVQEPIAIAIAAGVDDPEQPLGTDAARIQSAIESVYSEAGVVVLMDLGSAILSAEMALEFLPDDYQQHVRLCAAPLVEGAIAAVVQAAAGASLEQVVAEAQSALAAKVQQLTGSQTHLTSSDLETSQALDQTGTAAGQEIRLTVHFPMGIHARPAAQIVATANQFQADITLRNVTRRSDRVNAKSINQVVTLGVLQGHEVAIAAEGQDAQAAIAALHRLFEQAAVEADAAGDRVPPIAEAAPSASTPTYPDSQQQWQGIPASPGIATGPIVFQHPAVIEVVDHPIDDPQREWEDLQQAIQRAERQLYADIQAAQQSLGYESAQIFQAHLLYLEDPILLNEARRQIVEDRHSAAMAWRLAVAEIAADYQALEDSYLQARLADVHDIEQRVLRSLLGETSTTATLSESAILIAEELQPSDMARLNPHQILGIGTAAGSVTAHSTLMAKMLGIPMVVGLGESVLQLPAEARLTLNGTTGQVWIPSDDPASHSGHLIERTSTSLTQPAPQTAGLHPSDAGLAAITQDGHAIALKANIFGVTGAELAVRCGAAGVGLLRTEFFYLDRITPPTEDEQFALYQAIADLLETRPLTIRTMDIGGDKPVPYLHPTPEANPFLGWRGIRQNLDCPELLKAQLRAVLRVSSHYPVSLMLPMVSSVLEIRAAKQRLAEAQQELQNAGIAFDANLPVGIMVEVPAAVTMADQLAAEVDFMSIGTNDLSQYTMAADRTNPKVAPLADAFTPAVLRLIQQTAIAAQQAGILVSVCGELASQPEAIPILLGLGIRELSINPPAIAPIASVIRQLTLTEATAIAQEVLHLDSGNAVKAYVQQYLTLW